MLDNYHWYYKNVILIIYSYQCSSAELLNILYYSRHLRKLFMLSVQSQTSSPPPLNNSKYCLEAQRLIYIVDTSRVLLEIEYKGQDYVLLDISSGKDICHRIWLPEVLEINLQDRYVYLSSTLLPRDLPHFSLFMLKHHWIKVGRA